nr:alpha-2-macroglobulin-like protein [Paracentrotus lividus]
MTPRLNLLVYCILEAEDGEMIADSLQIDSNAVFENEVHIQVADGQNAELEPGAQTSIEIIATPESLCAIGVVDESVHLLGGDNQIQKTEVVSFLNRFQLSEGDSFNAPCQETEIEESKEDGGGIGGPIPLPFPQPIRQVAVAEPVQILARKKRQFGFFPPFSRDPYPKYTDVTKEFEELGLVRITNLNIETSPCERPEPFPYYYGFPQAFAVFADRAVALEAVAVGGPPAIRSYFPETWLWQLLRPEESPIVTVPDVITEWIGAGFCISPITGFGISEPFTVNAFKPFFGDYNLPYSVIRGEELQLQVNIFNYVDNCLPVEVTLRGSGEFDLVDSSNRKRVCVCSGSEPTQVTFDVRPLVLGEVDLETTFIIVYGQDICRGQRIEEGVTHSDGLRKPILVEPEGEEIEDSFNLYFCPSDEEDGIFRHTFEVTVPEEYVADSGRVIIFLSGDILGNSLTNIDSLLRIPSGCGEQNMIGFVPNIYALQYLQATGQADQLQTNKAISNIIKGYQGQLNFRRTSGAYSAFGNSDPEGSAWLSAYVVRSFAQAGQFIKIDNNDLQRTIRWLLNNLGQQDNGCFMNRGRVIHKEMQGGVNDEVSLTAFILVSLLEAGMPREDEAIVNALFCIGNSLGSLTDPNQETDTYSAALIAYALSIAKDPRVAIVMNYLESVAINEGGVKYWVSNRPQTGSSRRYGSGASASSISIEMTGYVLLTYINIHGIDGVALGSPVSKWLVSQQGPRGGFKSSQDTVVAIHALAEYAGLVFGGDTNLAVAIGYQEPCTLSSIFTIHGGNRLVLQRADLEHFPDIINVLATGDGCALIQVIIRFNVHPKPPPVPPFTLTYSVGPSGQLPCIRSFRLNVCVSYTGEDGFSNMAIVEVKLVSGFIPPRDLDSLIQGDLTLIEYRQKSLIFYFRQCTAQEICFSLDLESVHVVRDPKPGLIKVYDYYDPDLSLATEYELTCQLRPIPLPIEIVEEEDNVPPVEEIIVVPPEDEIIVPPEENFNL